MDPTKLFDIRGKRALVTGGTQGIGLMIARGLLLAGAHVILCSRKSQAVDAAVADLSSLGQAEGVAADLATEQGIATVAEFVNARGALHILVNNAGNTWGAPFEQFPRAGFEKVLALNLVAHFELTKALMPALRAAASKEDPARVIGIASIDGIRLPAWESYPYSASKAGLIHMNRHLGKFLAAENISVNSIAPGLFRSQMTASVIDFESEEDIAATASPLGDRHGMLEDIAGAVIFLSSRAGAWLTGVTIPVAGGCGTIDN
jgi:NAD(P)-dependent dehydrogenase (short-subunit alcohol dehydrogenase family)